MYERSRPRRSPARYLAPIALIVIALATYLIVQSRVGGDTKPTSPAHVSSQTTTRGTSHVTRKSTQVKAAFYVVRSGDSLSVISSRTGVPLPTLESLNPGVSSNSLQVGQRLRLRR